MCHGGEMAKGWCYAHIVWSRSSLHMRHDMELCDQSGEDQDKAWLDGLVAMEKGKSRLWSEGPRGGEAWGKIWHRWTEATVKSEQGQDRWTKEVIWWYGVDHIIQERSSQVLTHEDDQKAWSSLVLVWHQYLGRWNEMRKAKVWLVGHFISPVKRLCREVHDRI